MLDTKLVRFEVFRYSPEGPEDVTGERWQTYEVPCPEDWVVLDALNHIKDEIDPTLSHRWSCRMGVCGSCGMMINGVPDLTCKSFVRDLPEPIRVAPLANFPVVRDLVVELESFMEKLKSVKPWIIRKIEKGLEHGEYLQTPDELDRYKQFSMCINCALCYAACPVLINEPEFLGPAALALGFRYNQDSRDEGEGERLAVIGSPEGVWACSYANECSEVCPKHVDPAAAIQRSKLLSFLQWSRVLPVRGGR